MGGCVAGIRRFVERRLLGFAELCGDDPRNDFGEAEGGAVTDPYMQDVWVANCVDLIARNIGRAEFEVRRDGVRTGA